VFASRRVAYLLEVGGGCKAIKGDRSNRYVQTFSWLGSGVTGRMGVGLYL